jgi:RES domain-containing protein
VIYCAESIALAFLENMVRRQGVGFNTDFKIMVLEIPDQLKVQVVRVKELPTGWRAFNDYHICQTIGNKWFDNGVTPVLKVPSAVLPQSFNYVLHWQHADFKKTKLVEVVDLVPDERIEALLKKTELPAKGKGKR